MCFPDALRADAEALAQVEQELTIAREQLKILGGDVGRLTGANDSLRDKLAQIEQERDELKIAADFNDSEAQKYHDLWEAAEARVKALEAEKERKV